MKLQEKYGNKISFEMGLKLKQKKSVKMRFNGDIIVVYATSCVKCIFTARVGKLRNERSEFRKIHTSCVLRFL